MNNPSPLRPETSLLEQKTKSRSRVRNAYFCVLAVHVIPITVFLLIGCRKPIEEPQPDTNMLPIPPIEETTNLAPLPETNVVSEVPTVPPMPPEAPPMAPSAQQEYTVAQNDTFSSIATRFGVTAKAIQDANPNLDPRRLQIGQKLVIPAPGTAMSAAPAAVAGAGGEQIYTVQSGDNLTKIAAKFGTTIRAIRSANNLETDRIVVGQKLRIPAPAAPAPAPVR